MEVQWIVMASRYVAGKPNSGCSDARSDADENRGGAPETDAAGQGTAHVSGFSLGMGRPQDWRTSVRTGS
jgi:hypothetical protein